MSLKINLKLCRLSKYILFAPTLRLIFTPSLNIKSVLIANIYEIESRVFINKTNTQESHLYKIANYHLLKLLNFSSVWNGGKSISNY